MNKSIFRKAMENVRQHRDIKFAITEKKRKRFIIRNQKQTNHKFFFLKIYQQQKWSKLNCT